jgi:hypothetical protein
MIRKCKIIGDFRLDETIIFRSIENKFISFFYCNFHNDKDINHCTEEDKVLVITLGKKIMEKYNGCSSRNGARESGVSGTYDAERSSEPYDVYYSDVYTAVLFAFYALVLLELHGDGLSLEEICRFMRLQSSALHKIQEIYYGIAWGDDPILAEVRGRMLFPDRFVE